ncbi:OsmC family protein [Actinocorallia sp. A-T 12471]|uniref:OsmC family protein n=1 Tax=Actinocorallia sp. A-T 12471 TaxID=3089813 RepID=UPI0029D0CBA4|nr:OsmC family protein [Actinocorallia sp. A-T 12471]MDX6741665.1 OsmC family protein [Actinocorallia sp. A-T 12471]
MEEITVRHQDQDTFAILIRDHLLWVDQPHAGGDAGPTPLELLTASLAACAAHFARRHLKEHGIPDAGLEVGGRFTLATADAQRVAAIVLDVRPQWALSPTQREELHEALENCPVLTSLRASPRISATITCPDGKPRSAAVA